VVLGLGPIRLGKILGRDRREARPGGLGSFEFHRAGSFDRARLALFHPGFGDLLVGPFAGGVLGFARGRPGIHFRFGRAGQGGLHGKL
jgi:hypothetical protein